MLGKLVHIGFDALLISAFLAGVKRNTGLTYVSLCCDIGLQLISFALPDQSCLKYQTRMYDVSDISWHDLNPTLTTYGPVFRTFELVP